MTIKTALCLGLVFLLVQGTKAQKTRQVSTWPYKQYVLNGSDTKQEKNGLTVEIEPLSPKNLYSHPELYSFVADYLPQDFKKYYLSNINAMWTDYNAKKWNYTFGIAEKFLTVFKVKITNNTGHILKMSEAKILLRIENEDPIKPVTKYGDPSIQLLENPAGSGKFIPYPKSVLTPDESLIQWVTNIEAEYVKNKKKGFLDMEFPIGINSQIIDQNKKNYKLISDVNVEILPEDSYSGILLFPVIVSWEELSLKMYEFATKTDPAGNVAERSNFDFKLKLDNGNMWYDRNKNMWVDGAPPQAIEYFDKSTKTWILGTPPEK